MAENESIKMVSLNDVSSVVEAITGSSLKRLIQDAAGAPMASCTTLCDCNNIYCACRGSVTSVAQDMLSYPEFLQLRDIRIQDLETELRRLEKP